MAAGRSVGRSVGSPSAAAAAAVNCSVVVHCPMESGSSGGVEGDHGANGWSVVPPLLGLRLDHVIACFVERLAKFIENGKK